MMATSRTEPLSGAVNLSWPPVFGVRSPCEIVDRPAHVGPSVSVPPVGMEVAASCAFASTQIAAPTYDGPVIVIVYSRPLSYVCGRPDNRHVVLQEVRSDRGGLLFEPETHAGKLGPSSHMSGKNLNHLCGTTINGRWAAERDGKKRRTPTVR